ncbi:hypothetical protein DSCOOX_12270 [Desulfosarcina ovata subsp. ovata]|uniref:Uncharacterized protein n=1 Tax=Desulfosarcina ovata subsp. ovata TaxID=2752305 RepID=A0A5K8A6B2_9BACT|nr:hypothetical protein DSCOOX_12270 [Desulfosarcina ovata subsp. ovata]
MANHLIVFVHNRCRTIARVCGLSTSYKVTKKIKTLFENDRDNPELKDYSQLLLDMAVVSEGGKLDNPAGFSKMVGDLMSRAMG